MQQNCKHIPLDPLDISSNFSPRYTSITYKNTTNISTNSHISYDIRSNIYVQKKIIHLTNMQIISFFQKTETYIHL